MANETLTNVFSDIADAVRAKGVTGQMTPLQMPQKIADIPSGGSGDPFYEVDGQGVVQKTTGLNVNWFNDLTSIPVDGLKDAYSSHTQIVSASFPNLTTIENSGMYQCFNSCSNLSSVSLPKLQYLTGNGGQLREAFSRTALTSIELPLLQSASTMYGNNMSYLCSTCSSLVSASFPELTTLGNSAMQNAFEKCTSLKQVYFTKLSSASGSALNSCFMNCSVLELVDFHLATSVPAIATSTFSGTNNTFQIVVPDALYETWIAATNWSTYASQIVKYSEYTPSN